MNSLTFNGCRKNSDRTGLTEFIAVIRTLNTFPPSMAVMWWKYRCTTFFSQSLKAKWRTYSASPGGFAHNSVIFKVLCEDKVYILLNRLFETGGSCCVTFFFCSCAWSYGAFTSRINWCLMPTKKPVCCGCWPERCPALCKQMFEGGAASSCGQ